MQFRRMAFPDEFQDRLKPFQKKLRKALSESHADLSALLIDVNPIDELKDTEACNVAFVGLMHEKDHEQQEKQIHCKTALTRIVELLRGQRLANGTTGFIVAEPELRSEAQMVVADYRQYAQFGFEDLSLRDDTDMPTNVA